jgi:thiol-disulfide isomerase/thioredoxin
MLVMILLMAAFPGKSVLAKEVLLQRWPTDASVPALQLKDTEGKDWTLQGLRGKVVILNFWATWCAPCIDELPILNELASVENPKGKPVVLGVNFKESSATVQRFSDEHKFRYPILMDKSGEHFRKWTNGILPTTVLIDVHGRPRWRIVGELDRNDPGLKQVLEKMLDEQEARQASRAASKKK